MNRRVMKKTILASLLLGLALLVQNASAMPTPYLLPVSSYDDAWQGSTFYYESIGEEYLAGRIDYAVYDTTIMSDGSDEKALADALGLSGRYIYAYQVINDYDDSQKSVRYFEIFGNGQAPLDLYEASIGSHDDGSSGKAPTDDYLDGLKVVWDFTEGLLYSDDHSWFLVFTSDSAPVVGNYEVKPPDEIPSGPVPDKIPEPATVALLGLSVTLLRFGRKRRRAGQ